MSIDTKEFKKGNSLIVGKKIKDNEYEIDGVIVYDAYCLSSSKPYLLQYPNIILKVDEPVYICGHGDDKKQEISGYSMREIAVLLKYNTNISQIKKIVIMSCHGKHKNRQGDDMASLLQNELSGLGIQINVESVAEHTTIVVDYFDKALVVDKKYIKFLFSTHQTNLLNRLGCLKLIVTDDSLTITTELEDYLSKYGKEIAVHNYALISKGKDNKMDRGTKIFVYSNLSLLLSGIILIIGWLTNLDDKYLFFGFIYLFISIMAVIFSSGMVEWLINYLKDKKEKSTSHHTGNNRDSNNN